VQRWEAEQYGNAIKATRLNESLFLDGVRDRERAAAALHAGANARLAIVPRARRT
jgi:hypothetical protein